MIRLASLKLTLVGFVCLLLGLLHYYLNGASVYWLATPLLLLAVNLLSALICNSRFRRQGGLLVFHIGLLLVLILVGLGQLLVFVGQVEIVTGQDFADASLTATREGPWHQREKLAAIRFRQGTFRVDYGPQLARGRTRSIVHAMARDGRSVETRFGDRVPFVSRGYRFQTTSNKGHAVILTWTGEGDGTQTGAVHMPSYPLWDWKQVVDWTTPSGDRVGIELLPGAAVADDRDWVLDSRRASGVLWVTAASGRVRLDAGDSIAVAGGSLRFDGVRMWIGYQIFHDPTLPWLLAASLIAVLGLGWHFWGKFWSRGTRSSGRFRREEAAVGV